MSLDRILSFWERLTFQRVVLGMFAGLTGIALFVIWEQRDAVFITLTGSIFAMASIAAGISLLFVAGVAYLFMVALDRKTEQVMAVMNQRISEAEKHSARQDGEIARLHKVLIDTAQKEREDCDKRIGDMRHMIERFMAGKGGV